jgi:hypothetical protein
MGRLRMDGLGLVAGPLGSVFTDDIKAVQRCHPQREPAAASSSAGQPQQCGGVKRFHFHWAFPFASLALDGG